MVHKVHYKHNCSFNIPIFISLSNVEAKTLAKRLLGTGLSSQYWLLTSAASFKDSVSRYVQDYYTLSSVTNNALNHCPTQADQTVEVCAQDCVREP